MQRAARKARLERAKAIGRIVYRYARNATIFGFIEVEGERKLVRDFMCGTMSIEFYEVAGLVSCNTDFSQIRVHYADCKVFFVIAGARPVISG